MPSRPHSPLPAAGAPPARPKRIYQHIYFQVLVGVVIGVFVGYLRPGWGVPLKPLGDGFVNLIKMLIAPIIFTTVVAGIAKVGDLGKVGRVGLKALIYFEVVTTLAMVIGLGVVHAIQPGKGLPAAVTQAPASGKDAEKVKEYEEKGKKQNAVDFILHVIPNTVVSAFSEGEILQVLLVSVLVGAALARMGAPAAPLVHAVDLTAQAFMTVVGFVVRLAPLAAFGAMAYTVGSAGLPALVALAKLMAAVYLTCLLFVFVVLELIMRANGFSLWRYLRYIKEEILLVLGTSSSESALPPLIAKLERVGCAKNVVGIVLPAGYSFNLDGTSIYLVMATVFISQATNTPLTLGQELFLLGILLLTSKGAAAVTGGGFITLAATISATGALPVAGLAPLIGIDRFMSEARAITNLIGNGVATLVVAKSEGELDYGLAAPVLLRPHAGTGTEPDRGEALVPAPTGPNGAPATPPRRP